MSRIVHFTDVQFNNLGIFLNRVPTTGVGEASELIAIVQQLQKNVEVPDLAEPEAPEKAKKKGSKDSP